ncbi:DNA-binding response regulator [Photobacterium proteolyticum]|uniref:DNA-binding response regulator n=1 Tax=Photobacterium proteolyticum TaxID=1903952 RepID=A0A1Q9H0U4_9GAMM|nr:response regulator transcription factor [Photobacterium proteolyticum]OLQ81161.1 DNA-binding response regulator [Photobacterium proteolyticum]
MIESENKILLIEDDSEIARLTKMYLETEGYETKVIDSGDVALDGIKEFAPDVVLLDLMLPGLDGAEICRRAREFYTGMILVLTASADEMSEVTLFKLGADDYVTKPVRGHILLARIEALLRRSRPKKFKLAEGVVEKFGISLHNSSQRAFFNNKQLDLTVSEYEVLQLLFEHSGEVVSREECCKHIRGIDYNVNDRSIDMRISGLRRKLSTHNVNKAVVRTIRNKGYMLSDA